MKDNIKSCKWFITINNPGSNIATHDSIKDVLSGFDLKYCCMCDEIGKNDTYHTHLLIITNNAVSFEYVKNKFPFAHIDFCRGTVQAVRDYIRKEGKYKGTAKEETNIADTFEEFGVFPE